MDTDELSRYLSALEREDCYRVDATLKEAPYEVTQRVYFVGANGAERGPYVRKLICRESGMGAAYERIFEAQQQGRRFKHVPAIHECYNHDDLFVVVMEHVNGETLQDLVFRRDPSVQLAVEVFPSVCDAVTELHGSFDPPLIHRDLKPSNVMLWGGVATVIDFGIARAYREGAESDTMKFGTRAFAPPEQFGFGQTTVRSDVYALGMILYFCLTEQISTQQVRDAGFNTSDVPHQLRGVLVRATALDPSERYASADELKAAFLEAAAACGAPEDAGNDCAEPSGTHRFRTRRRAGALAAALACAAALTAVGVGVVGQAVQPHMPTGDNAGAARQATSDGAAGVGASGEAATWTDGGDAAGETGGSPDSAGADAAASELAASAQADAPLRNGFDPATNLRVSAAGVIFQIPQCFGARVVQGDGGVTYYYAESGSTLAMIMTAENAVEPVGEGGDVASLMDSYLVGLANSDDTFEEVVSYTDFELVGHPARIATFRGTVKEHAVTTKAVYFISADTSAIGSIVFGQTDDAQFDYSADFAKTIASAT